MNGGLSLGNGFTGTRAGNLDAEWVTVVAPATPDAEFLVTLQHIGRLPIGYIVVSRSAACNVYDGRPPDSWGVNYLWLKCDTADVELRVLII